VFLDFPFIFSIKSIDKSSIISNIWVTLLVYLLLSWEYVVDEVFYKDFNTLLKYSFFIGIYYKLIKCIKRKDKIFLENS
jgi:hypothetical protein